jgi:hypothetical protein
LDRSRGVGSIARQRGGDRERNVLYIIEESLGAASVYFIGAWPRTQKSRVRRARNPAFAAYRKTSGQIGFAVHVDQPCFVQFIAHAVDVHPQFTGGQAGRQARYRHARCRELRKSFEVAVLWTRARRPRIGLLAENGAGGIAPPA